MNNRDSLIWLNNITGVTNRTIEKLENYYESLENIWLSCDEEILSLKNISTKVKNEIIKCKNKSYYDKVIEEIENKDVKVITILDENYPKRLRDIYDCPKVLYIKGTMPEDDENILAIVGARKATIYGKWAASKIANDLLDRGITLISGMASGIDTEVHISAIKKNKKNIAVLGCGVDVIYPKSNKNVYSKIIENGCVISEFPLGTQPLRHNFPQRNRIISGLSLGVVVIEASEKSGSLITATHAAEQGKDVFALPGNINSIYSIGTNKLIKDGAKLVLDVEDILEEIRELKDVKVSSKKRNINYDSLSEDEKKIISYIKQGPIHSDIICHKTKINISKLNSILTILEMKGIVKRLPNQLFTIA